MNGEEDGLEKYERRSQIGDGYQVPPLNQNVTFSFIIRTISERSGLCLLKTLYLVNKVPEVELN
jgi:hypothetical protein